MNALYSIPPPVILPKRSECTCVCHHGWSGYHEEHVCCDGRSQDRIDVEENRRSAAIEAMWKERQGDEYGSY